MIVTVVTPTLNGVAFLRECIRSTRENESPGIELEHVIIDGGSTDGTVELAESYGLRVLKRKGQGILARVNEASFNSSGELLGFLGADDLMLDGAMEAIVQAYRRSGKRWIVGGVRWIDKRDRSLGELGAPPTWMTPRMYPCLGWNPICHSATYLSRDLFTELRGFNIDYDVCGDYELLARALSIARYERLGHPVVCSRRTGMNYSVVNKEQARRENQAVLAEFGPKSKLEQRLWRYVLKYWLNLTNPHWLIHKLVGPAPDTSSVTKYLLRVTKV